MNRITKTEEAEVTRHGLLDMQVCVPKDWSDKQVQVFAEQAEPCGTTGGWTVRKQGSDLLAGQDERVQCEDHNHRVHVMLDA